MSRTRSRRAREPSLASFSLLRNIVGLKSRIAAKNRVPRQRRALIGGAVIAVLALMAFAPAQVSAQTQYVTASPGYVNLGMQTYIVATAPAAGSYTLVVQRPDGAQSTQAFTPTASGQVLNATYGNSTTGFMAVIDQVGTYNVYLEQGSTVVSTTSFYATNRLTVSIDMVDGGTCAYIAGATRGTKMFPRFYITFASNGAPMTNLDPGAYVTYTLPDGSHANATWDRFVKLFVGKLQPDWNFTYVGPWNPTAVIGDSAGNGATYVYTGNPYVISPVELSTSVQVMNTATGNATNVLQDGTTVTIDATVTYPTNAEPVPGFVGPLDSSRGGVVTAQVGWGYYNTTSGTFGGASPGALLGTVQMTYTGSNGTWSGQFASSSLPKLQPGAGYEVVVSSKDGASPSNTGFATLTLAPATASQTGTTITSTTVSVSTQNVVQTVQSIPTAVYAALAILLIVGVIVGYIVRVPR